MDRYDKGAVKVMRLNGEQLGFVPADVSRAGDPTGLAFRMDRGDQYHCRVKELTGGNGRTRGVNIEITSGADFDALLSFQRTESALMPQLRSDAPANGYLWLVLTGAGVVVLIIPLILRN
jgi:hypothetical protein